MNAVITGASRGIGKAVASVFALHGYNLLLGGHREERLLQTVEELKTSYPSIIINAMAMDLSNNRQAQLFGSWAVQNAESIDVLVNNAGSFLPGNVSDEPDGTLEKMIDTNLYSA